MTRRVLTWGRGDGDRCENRLPTCGSLIASDPAYALSAVVLAVVLASALPAAAQETGPIHQAIAHAVDSTSLTASGDDPQSPAPRHVAFEYSDGYKTRAKIHKYAAFATLPLFATEFYLGQSIYNTPSDGKKNAHIAVGSGIIGLYGLQGVTGVWNLLEAKKDPNQEGKKRRLAHTILMLASGAGFALTPATAPGTRDRLEFGNSSASTHRAVAYTSIGIGTAGYLLMLFGGK
jgi:hypothetical protein